MGPTIQPTSIPSPGASNPALLIVLVAIAVVLIALVALVVYTVYSRNKKSGAPHAYKSTSAEVSRVNRNHQL
jgi:flagellar basal body-associated protein FliL